MYFTITDRTKVKNVVYRVINRFKADKTFEPKQRTGRLPMTTKWEERMIVKMFLKNRFHIGTSIFRAFSEQIGKPISTKTGFSYVK